MRFVPELQKGSPEYMEDRIDIWRSIIDHSHTHGRELTPGRIGPVRDLAFANKEGEECHGTEEFVYGGKTAGVNREVYALNIFANCKMQAELRYHIYDGVIKISQANTSPQYQGYGMNSRLFQDMSDLHPDIMCVYTNLDDSNIEVYMSNVQKGMDPVIAARYTPAGKVRERAGWRLDEDRSWLARWDKDIGKLVAKDGKQLHGPVRLNYRRDAIE